MSGIFSRAWCMPNHETFKVAPIRELLNRWVPCGKAVVVDPFARDSKIGTITNDLDDRCSSLYHMDALAFCEELNRQGVVADAVLMDPPYSPRQMAEVYRSVGLTGRNISQTAKLYSEVRAGLDRLLRPGGLAISFGWNSVGFGLGYERLETLLVCHGGAHNDTICVVEQKT